MSRRAVFLDRDGTLIRERGFITDPAQLEVLPGVEAALDLLIAGGYAPVVVTNQSGVARGLLTEADLARVHGRLHALLGRRPLAYFHCPHHPDAGESSYTRDCECRKPGGGLLHQAAETLGLQMAGSFMVGDAARDVMAARGLPVRTVLVRSGLPWRDEVERLRDAEVAVDLIAEHLPGAVDWMLQAR